MNKLTPKQKVFCDEYLKDLNATRSYKKAYKNCKNDNTAAVNGNRLLRNAKVKDYLDERMKTREKRTEITQDRVLKELAAIAFANAADYSEIKNEFYKDEYGQEQVRQTVEFINTENLSEDKKKAIIGMEKTKYGIKVSYADKMKALELLGKHLGMYKEKVELSGEVNNPFEGLSTEELLRIAKSE